MMTRCLLGALTLFLWASVAAADDYLTKDGQLKQTLEVTTAQGGFAGFTGPMWVIEPSGKWKSGFSSNGQLKKVESQGELTKEQLAALAAALAKYDLLGLPKQEGKPSTNHFVATIKFGKQAQLLLPAGSKLPQPGPKEVAERYAGIVEAVKRVTKPAKQ